MDSYSHFLWVLLLLLAKLQIYIYIARGSSNFNTIKEDIIFSALKMYFLCVFNTEKTSFCLYWPKKLHRKKSRALYKQA